MKIETVDQRIRNKAREELRAELNKAKNDFIRAIQTIGTSYRIAVKVTDKSEVKRAEVFNTNAITAIVDEAYSRLAPRREEAAINAFIKQVEGFQEQLNRMYGDIYEE